ncbi:MAG: peptidylprolyl isomerase [Sphingobacteriia bacterium]|nr:peptidylprolyl isomerase [Sphingobacteriia bacterium]NCC38767.1 peptidylprolyl isomerase [Gammaproteobacteria bacterium]
MAESSRLIAPGRSVELHLEIRFSDGFVALSTFGEEPVCCVIGDGTLAPALESALLGLAAGSETHVIGNGSELFAPYDETNLHWMEREDFPAVMDPLPGQVIAFTTPAGHETCGLVRECDEQRVRVDFNHPFAGRSLTIRVRVLAVGSC